MKAWLRRFLGVMNPVVPYSRWLSVPIFRKVQFFAKCSKCGHEEYLTISPGIYPQDHEIPYWNLPDAWASVNGMPFCPKHIVEVRDREAEPEFRQEYVR